jgi:hypothetical protein
MRPALTAPARGGCEIDGRDGRMARGAAEQKNGRTAISAIVVSVMKKNRLSISSVAGGGSRTGVAVQASPADCAYSMARRVCPRLPAVAAKKYPATLR